MAKVAESMRPQAKEKCGHTSSSAIIDWDEDTRKVIEKDQADEDGHINKWKKLLKEL
jgi:hypothetical protein